MDHALKSIELLRGGSARRVADPRFVELRPADQLLSRLLGGVRAAILLSCETDSPMGQAHGASPWGSVRERVRQ